MSRTGENAARGISCKVLCNTPINNEIFQLDFAWREPAAPRAGQFFMIKPKRSAVFLARPISVAMYTIDTVTFLIARRGGGTLELAAMYHGEEAELIGPLGNAWADFLPPPETCAAKAIALIGGGIGLAPFYALFGEKPEYCFDLYAGFRTGFHNAEEKNKLLGAAYPGAKNVIVATEDGTDGNKGRIPDFLEPKKHAAVCACGPEPMLKAVAAKCTAAGVPCFISMEKRMACGVGVCLGCAVKTVNGNRRCCADGPVFRADEVIFDE